MSLRRALLAGLVSGGVAASLLAVRSGPGGFGTARRTGRAAAPVARLRLQRWRVEL